MADLGFSRRGADFQKKIENFDLFFFFRSTKLIFGALPKHFDTFSEIHFWPTDPKIFLKAPLAPIYTNFEGERAPKKTRFFCQNFSKSAQKRLFWQFFFQKFACGAENLAKMGAKKCFGRAPKINFVDLKKKRSSNFRFFLKIRPPRENPRSAPGTYQGCIRIQYKLKKSNELGFFI